MISCYSPLDKDRLVPRNGKMVEEMPKNTDATLEPDNG